MLASKFPGMSLFLPITPETGGNKALAAPAWETLVLFAVNFTKLNVQMNMSNVMGNVMWVSLSNISWLSLGYNVIFQLIIFTDN